LEVTQPIGTFYLVSAAASQILSHLTVSRRGLTAEERDHVQRALDPSRQKDIAIYVRRKDATFPTSITVNADSSCVFVVRTEAELKLVIGREYDSERHENIPVEARLELQTAAGARTFVPLESGVPAADIIDGQHRFEGLRRAIQEARTAADPELWERLQNFGLTLAVMFDLVPEQCAKVFVTINSTQRKVDSSHIADLFALHTTRSPQRVSHLIAVTVNELKGSPFEDGLRMLGKRVNEGQYLSQGSFTKYLMELLPRATSSGEPAPTKGNKRLFADLYEQKKDKQIAQIVIDFFTAVMNTYPTAWKAESDSYLIRKTVGFAALIKFLSRIGPTLIASNNADYAHFHEIMGRVRNGFPEDRWKVGEFSSSDADAGRIAKQMEEALQ
jgi:DGQHR domain-containing protein